MNHCIWLAVALGAAASVVADSGHLTDEEGLPRGIARGERVGAAAETVATSPDSATAVKEPTGALALPEALALALVESPVLAPFDWQERVSEARVLQARLRVNPELSLEVEDVLGTGVFQGGSQAQITLQLSQVIELGGKRAARAAVATQAQGLTRFSYEVARVDVLADVTQRFINVVGAQRSLDLAVTVREMAEDVLRTVQERAKAGRASALEATKAQVALARAKALVEATRHELHAARKVLAASWQNSSPVFERAEADLFARRPLPPYQELKRRLSSSPAIARWVSEKSLREAEAELADALRAPNLTLGAGIRHLQTFGEEAFVFGLSLPLPLFNRNQGGVVESRAALGWVEAEQEAVELRLGMLLLGLYEEAVRKAHIMEGLEHDILPQAEEALAISREGYTQGRFSYLEVLDAQRTVFDVTDEYIRTATSYHKLLVEIERLIGQPFMGVEPRR